MTITESIYAAARTTEALVKTWLGTDDHVNKEPIHDDAQDIDSDDINRIVKGLSECAKRTRRGNLCAYSFSIANATAGLSSQALLVGGGNDAAWEEYPACWDGSIVGIAVRVENARSAGTATITPTVDGVAAALTATIDGTNTQTVRMQQLPGVETFSSVARLGAEITTDGSWAAGSTPSVWVDVLVSYGEEEDI